MLIRENYYHKDEENDGYIEEDYEEDDGEILSGYFFIIMRMLRN